MTTQTKTKLDDAALTSWPPKAHLIRREDHPPAEGTRALCGAKLMGIDLDGASVKQPCKKCVEIASRGG